MKMPPTMLQHNKQNGSAVNKRARRIRTFRKHTTRSQVRSRLHPNRRCPRRESEATDIEGWGKSSKEELLTEVTKYLVEQGVAEDHSVLRAKYAHCHNHRVAVLANQALLRIRESKKKLQAETSQTRTGEVLARLAPSSGGCGSTTGAAWAYLLRQTSDDEDTSITCEQ